MSFTAARKSITKFFATGWDDETPVAYDDVEFGIPEIDDADPAASTWVRLQIQHFDAYQASVGSPGSNKFRRNGLITAQIFAAEKQAALDALAKGDMIVSLFQGKSRFEGVIFSNVRLKEIGPDGEGWFQVNVKIDFEFDDLA